MGNSNVYHEGKTWEVSKLALKSWCLTQFEVERLKSRNRLPGLPSLTNPAASKNPKIVKLRFRLGSPFFYQLGP